MVVDSTIEVWESMQFMLGRSHSPIGSPSADGLLGQILKSRGNGPSPNKCSFRGNGPDSLKFFTKTTVDDVRKVWMNTKTMEMIVDGYENCCSTMCNSIGMLPPPPPTKAFYSQQGGIRDFLATLSPNCFSSCPPQAEFFFDPRLHSRFAKKVLGKKTCKPLSPLPRLYPTNFLSSDCFFLHVKNDAPLWDRFWTSWKEIVSINTFQILGYWISMDFTWSVQISWNILSFWPVSAKW